MRRFFVISSNTREIQSTALGVAVNNNDIEIVKLLLATDGIDVNAVNEYSSDDCKIKTVCLVFKILSLMLAE